MEHVDKWFLGRQSSVMIDYKYSLVLIAEKFNGTMIKLLCDLPGSILTSVDHCKKFKIKLKNTRTYHIFDSIVLSVNIKYSTLANVVEEKRSAWI